MFPDNRSDLEIQLDLCRALNSVVQATNDVTGMLMELALIYKREQLFSCANDLVECAKTTRQVQNVMTSILHDKVESADNGS